jgi:hypothetical protein
MPRPKGVTDNGTSQDHGKPLAAPLDVAAQVLGRPLHELERADVEPYIAGDGRVASPAGSRCPSPGGTAWWPG